MTGKKSRPSDKEIERQIGIRIRMRRNELGMSQETLGDTLGLTFQQVQKYEKGANRVGGARLVALAEALGVEVEFFYRGIEHRRTGHIEPNARVEDFLASKIGLRIAVAFGKIESEALRAAIMQIIESAADK